MRFHPLLNTKAFHTGIDIDGAAIDSIMAAMTGQVVEAGQKGYLGNYLLLDHGGGFHTAYGHMSRFAEIAVGDCVTAGQIIAYRGSTGLSAHPHLHFEVIRGGQFVNPAPMLVGR